MGKKRGRASHNEEFERLDKLPWKSSISSDDPFSVFADGEEGGFLSLEEIDESLFNLAIPQSGKQTETGSGKTLAFGLPILQRVLDEEDKVEKRMIKDQEDAEKIAPRSLIRALIITPTRELALQVTDHLKAAARYTKVRVVSIVGGMSTEKQERLLRTRPEIIVGTPGRLWELMSGGEKHLVENVTQPSCSLLHLLMIMLILVHLINLVL